MLRALYKDGDIPEGEMLKFEALAKHYELEFRPGWLFELQKELREEGLLKGPANGRNDAQAIGRLTGPGMREAERLIDALESRGTVLIDQYGPADAAISNDAGQEQSSLSEMVSEIDAHEGAHLSIDSTTWTGKRLVLADAAVLSTVRLQADQLRERIYSTRFESNVDSQDLKSLADALVAVCAMAEPELGIIERILAHPKFAYTATLAAAVATIRGALGI
ncbi:hypothetical protein [Altererythrobacter sp. Z27]|uniref:hypothetical protein n=1 Tax=Altererythrobacter sp. Z27 TaxID=3461147 RepID=UPI004043F588